jgi:hypothetical protein
MRWPWVHVGPRQGRARGDAGSVSLAAIEASHDDSGQGRSRIVHLVRDLCRGLLSAGPTCRSTMYCARESCSLAVAMPQQPPSHSWQPTLPIGPVCSGDGGSFPCGRIGTLPIAAPITTVIMPKAVEVASRRPVGAPPDTSLPGEESVLGIVSEGAHEPQVRSGAGSRGCAGRNAWATSVVACCRANLETVPN